MSALPPPNDVAARQFLTSNNWPVGLQEQLIQGATKIPLRFILVDNSGSMMANDGQYLVAQGNVKKFLECSRWTELTTAVRFHASLAEAARAPTEFRIINNSQPLLLGTGEDNGQRCFQLLSLLDQPPSGATPLCMHINQIVPQIQALAPQLVQSNQKVALVIATDGEPSDGDIAQALRPLKDLPVLLIIRLCTAEQGIANFWKQIDQQLELQMDVLDDLESEAKEIAKINDWFTYGEPLHRLREFGIPLKDLDMIDEDSLSQEQMRRVMAMITVGGPASEIPNPQLDWPAFEKFVKSINDRMPTAWDPISKTPMPWIRMRQLEARYKPASGGCCTIS